MTAVFVDLPLDLSPLIEPAYEPEASLADRFAAFHAANPHVADALEQLAGQWFAAGHRKVGMKALVERLRWESGIRTEGSAYRVNNSHVSFYARLLLERLDAPDTATEHARLDTRLVVRATTAPPRS